MEDGEKEVAEKKSRCEKKVQDKSPTATLVGRDLRAPPINRYALAPKP